MDLVGDRVTAKVQGSQLYEVRLNLGRNDFGARCSCPYDWGGYCKHIVATLLRLEEMDLQDLKSSSEERVERAHEALRNADGEKLKEFLKKEFTRNPDLQKRFLVNFGNSTEENTVEDYKKQVRELYREVAGSGGIIQYDEHIDFSTFYDLAKDHSERGNAQEAAKIYRAVSEVIAEEMDRVDDSTGYYGDEFHRAIAHYGGVLAEGNLNGESRNTHIEYLFEKYLENDSDYFREYYKLNSSTTSILR
ncbi:SWIM zinc finger family protein [Candidatus Bipolaricaulota bacterium]|nr:SWIM zinc finger family protein [Candidatus Bipolaricaulota bacterium]